MINVVLIAAVVIYVSGMIATGYKIMPLDTPENDNPFFALGAVCVTLLSWVGFFLLAKEDKE